MIRSSTSVMSLGKRSVKGHLIPGFPRRQENLGNENGHGKVMAKTWNMKNSWNFVISHGN